MGLYEILDKINRLIYNEFRMNITKSMTISGLAMKIYTSNFINHKIYKVRGKIHDDIRIAFYGGRVDVFNPKGERLYQYDVNSLYPHSMLNDMPIGKPRFTNNPNLKDYFGFVFAEIKSPEYMFIPTLPHRDNNKMFCPLGSWKGWYFSEELKQAEEFGYEIKVLYGYQFNRGKEVFDNYVYTCYYHKKKFYRSLKRNL